MPTLSLFRGLSSVYAKYISSRMERRQHPTRTGKVYCRAQGHSATVKQDLGGRPGVQESASKDESRRLRAE